MKALLCLIRGHRWGTWMRAGRRVDSAAQRQRVRSCDRCTAVDDRYASDDMSLAPMFGHALRDRRVRAELAMRGYVHGSNVVVGRYADADDTDQFRVWPDRAVPGGWNGEPL